MNIHTLFIIFIHNHSKKMSQTCFTERDVMHKQSSFLINIHNFNKPKRFWQEKSAYFFVKTF